MKISKIHIENFRSIKETESKINGHVSGFAGGNGSGKSNILKAIQKFLDQSEFNSSDYYQLEHDKDIRIDISFNDFTESEKEEILKILNIKKLEEITISRVGDTYKLISPEVDLSHLLEQNLDTGNDENVNSEINNSDEKTDEEHKTEGDNNTEVEEQEKEPVLVEVLAANLFKKIMPHVEYIGNFANLLETRNKKISGIFNDDNLDEKMRTLRQFLELGNITKSMLLNSNLDERTKEINKGVALIGEKLRGSWLQEKLIIRIAVDDDTLVIQFRDGINIDETDDTKWIWNTAEDLSDGLRWYLTFYTKYLFKLGKKYQEESLIFLLDDAGGPLNKIAQENLLNEFYKLLNNDGKKVQIFYSTHSKYMIEWHKIENTYLIDKNPHNLDSKMGGGSTIIPIWWKTDSKNWPAPLNDLGVSSLDDLLSSHNLVVEGFIDRTLISGLINIALSNFSLGEDEIKNLLMFSLFPGGGAPVMPSIGQKCKAFEKKYFLLFDSDKGAKPFYDKAKNEGLFCVSISELLTNQSNQGIKTTEDLIPINIYRDSFNKAGRIKFNRNWKDILRVSKEQDEGIVPYLKKRVINNLGSINSSDWQDLKLKSSEEVIRTLKGNSFENPDVILSFLKNLEVKLAAL